MSLKQRLDKLEKRQPDNFGTGIRIIVYPHETEKAAYKRWQDENPGAIPPAHIIYRVIV